MGDEEDESSEGVFFTYDPNSPDPMEKQRYRCMQNKSMQKLLEEFEKCQERVTAKIEYTKETCTQEVIDIMEALDHCASLKAFPKLA